MFTSDFLHLGLTLFVKAFVCFGFMMSPYNDLYFPTGWAGETLSVLGRVCLGFSSSTPDRSHFGFLMLLRSIAQLGLSLLALDFLRPGLFLFSQSLIRVGLLLFASSKTKMGLPLLLMDFADFESTPLLQSMAHSGSGLPVLDLLNPGSTTFPQGPAYSGLVLSAPDFSKIEPTLLLRDSAKLGSNPSLVSMVKSDSCVSVLDFVDFASLLLVQSLS